jgi:hypothetical protein
MLKKLIIKPFCLACGGWLQLRWYRANLIIKKAEPDIQPVHFFGVSFLLPLCCIGESSAN